MDNDAHRVLLGSMELAEQLLSFRWGHGKHDGYKKATLIRSMH